MSFASDIQTTTRTSTGLAVSGRSRLSGLYFVNTATAATLTFRDGAGGAVVMTINTPPVAGGTDIMLPDNGILCTSGIHITFSSAEVTSCMVMYVGGGVPA